MRIGEVASGADVNIQTLRYYERRGLLPAPRRQASGYRCYDQDVVQRVRFIRRAQDLGFTLQEISDLLALWSDSARACGAAERRASATLERIDQRIGGLKRMRKALGKYVTACRDRDSLDACPLLSALGGDVMHDAGERGA